MRLTVGLSSPYNLYLCHSMKTTKLHNLQARNQNYYYQVLMTLLLSSFNDITIIEF